ncbi:MAG: hypothetical protein JWR69_1082 [Pedosphaera sp.]|nr:hypothetical protein [Pedosphaera sp.]
MNTHLLKTVGSFQLAALLVLLGSTAPSRAGGLVAAWGDNSLGQTSLPQGVNSVKAVAASYYFSMALKTDGSLFTWGQGSPVIPPGLLKIKAIAAGESHVLALKSDGTVVAWGSNNSYGQTNVPVGLSGVTAISAGGPIGNHNLALKADGTVVEWGEWGSYGGGAVVTASVPAGLSGVTAISAGSFHDLALKADGTITAWGDNTYGQTNVPPGLTDVIAISAGQTHNLALREDGIVFAWGDNTHGQAAVPASLSNVVAIAAGQSHSLALKADGSVVAWGDGSFGQTNIPPGLTNVTAIAAGGNQNLAIVSAGPVQILQAPASLNVPWSSNVSLSVTAAGQGPLSYQWLYYGAAVDTDYSSGNTTSSLTLSHVPFSGSGPYAVLVSNSFGSVISTSAVLTVIGPPIIDDQTLGPIKVRAGTDLTLSVTPEGTPPLSIQWQLDGTDIPGATNNKLFLFNAQPTVSGTYLPRVSNAYGTAPSIGIQVTVTNAAPYFLTQPTARTAIVGGSTTFSVTARGSLPLTYQWRLNGNDIPGATNSVVTLTALGYGQTGFYNCVVGNAFGEAISAKALLSVLQTAVWGNGFTINPTNVPTGLTNLVAVAAGNSHILGLGADGKMVTWLSNPFGGSLNNVTNVPASASNVIAIAAGGNASMVLRSNGTVVAWGGIDSSLQTNLPTGLSNVTAISMGGTFALALKTNGTVTAWGSASFGQTRVPDGLSNVIAIAAGSSHALALKSDGNVAAWGSGGSGQTNIPAGLSNVIAIAAGSAHSVALKSDGTVKIWGNSSQTNIPFGLSNVVAIAAAPFGSVALQADGLVRTLGIERSDPPVGVSNYFAIAAGGSQSSFFVGLVGNGSPVMTIQPASRTITNGMAVQLDARAVGRKPLSYQWQLNGQNLPGATNVSLAITNAQGKDTGAYRMLASNALGTATSALARLTIAFSTNLDAALSGGNLKYITGISNTAWFAENQVTHDGSVAAQSGPITNNQQSSLQTTVVGPGTLTFWWKVSSEEGFDFLRFFMNGTNTFPLANLSGEVDWQQQTFVIPSGSHQLNWIYAKDASVSDGLDAGWVDQVVFTPTPPTILLQPSSKSTWMGSNVTFETIASGSQFLTYQWLKFGTNVPGATDRFLTLPHVTRRDSGVYTVKVIDGLGSVVSSNATLLVQVPQRLSAPVLQLDGSLLLSSRDADGGLMLPSDLAGFELQASTNLTNWTTLTNALTCTNGSVWASDPNRTNYPPRFYRLVEH